MTRKCRVLAIILFLMLVSALLPVRAAANTGESRISVQVSGECAGLFSGGRQIRLTSGNVRCTVFPLLSGMQDVRVVVTQRLIRSRETLSRKRGRTYRREFLRSGEQTELTFLLRGRSKSVRYTIRAFVLPEIRIDDPIPSTCDQIFDEFVSENLKIRACTSDAQCGKALPGTSCGCTRDFVAREDADTTEFYSILARAEATSCSESLPIVSSCDCPVVSGIACINGMCDWKVAGS